MKPTNVTSTTNSTISLIAAWDENGVIGNKGAMPWHLPADLKHFKALTLGKPILMGRRTFEAIGKPLPGRRNLVLTRSADFEADGVEVFYTLDDAFWACADCDEIMVIGGGELYRQALPMADRLYLTRIHAELDGDTFFPDFDESQWKLVEETRRESDARNAYALSFRTFMRNHGSQLG